MMKRLLLLCAFFASAFWVPAQAQQAQDEGLTYGIIAPAAVNPALPNVLLLGDSISLGYAPVVEAELAGKANVYHIKGTEAATVRRKGSLRLDTQSALKHLDDWLSNIQWSVIHFNWGLHDVKIVSSGEHQTPLAQYGPNLRELVKRLQATHARLIWASTTPVPEGTETGSIRRKAGDEIPYNEVARQVMAETNIPVDDLHALVAPRLSEFQRPANVHFTSEGSKALGAQVAGKVEEALQKSAPSGGKSK